MTSVLYITYDGLLEPLGESQVVAYLERLAADHRITLMSFEKPADLEDTARVSHLGARLRACGIAWIRLRYHKRPSALATAFDVLHGIWRARRAARADRFAVVHARSYVPSLIALGGRGASGAKFVFDMRGFWIDEKIEAGHWPADGWLSRLARRWERRFFAEADAIVSLTEAGVEALPQLGHRLRPGVTIDVIPTCADLARFSPGPRDAVLMRELHLEGHRIIGCVGTMGNWYLRDPMLQYLALLARRLDDAKVLIVTRDDHAALRRDAEACGLPSDRLVLTSSSFADMPRYMRLMDVAMFFISPSPSKRGSAATKLAELLGSGVPVIVNDGVGDSGRIVRDARVGIVLADVTAETQAASVDAVRDVLADPGMAARCRAAALARFDLSAGVDRYRRLYAMLHHSRV